MKRRLLLVALVGLLCAAGTVFFDVLWKSDQCIHWYMLLYSDRVSVSCMIAIAACSCKLSLNLAKLA